MVDYFENFNHETEKVGLRKHFWYHEFFLFLAHLKAFECGIYM